MPERNWSTKTLARQLVAYLRTDEDFGPESTLKELMESLKSSIVEEEVGVDLDVWGDG